MNRQQRRTIENKVGKKGMEELTQKVFEFSNIPEKCGACQEPFNKKDKVMVQSWRVVVREEVIRLFCPDCLDKVKEILNERS
jgi:hypothetical protein